MDTTEEYFFINVFFVFFFNLVVVSTGVELDCTTLKVVPNMDTLTGGTASHFGGLKPNPGTGLFMCVCTA